MAVDAPQSSSPSSSGKTSSSAGKTSSSSGKTSGSRRMRNRRRGGGDADLSLDESHAEQSGSVSESSTTSQSSSTISDAPRPAPDGEQLMSKTLIIQNKRFYVDVRENSSGKFVKLAEVLPDGRKSRLSLTMRVARQLRNHLTKFSEFYASLGPAAPVVAASSAVDKPAPSPTAASTQSDSDAVVPASPDAAAAASTPRTPPLKSAVIYVTSGKSSGKRRYFIDLRENRRGRFLQISEAAQKDGYTQRYRIAIPAQGLVEVRDTLSGILRDFVGSEDDDSFGGETRNSTSSSGVGKKTNNKNNNNNNNNNSKANDSGIVVRSGSASDDNDLPIAKSMRVHPGKVIYFDPGTNPRGDFVKISQVTTRFRTSILLPTETLSQVTQILNELQKGFNGGNNRKTTSTPKSKGQGRSYKSRGKASSKPGTAAAAAPAKTVMAAA